MVEERRACKGCTRIRNVNTVQEAPAFKVCMWVMEESRVHVDLWPCCWEPQVGPWRQPWDTHCIQLMWHSTCRLQHRSWGHHHLLPPRCRLHTDFQRLRMTGSELPSTSGKTYNPPTTTTCSIHIFVEKAMAKASLLIEGKPLITLLISRPVLSCPPQQPRQKSH